MSRANIAFPIALLSLACAGEGAAPDTDQPADLVVAVVGPTQARVWARVRYTLTIVNAGPGDATGISVSARIAPSGRLLEVSPGATVDAGVARWQIDRMLPDDTLRRNLIIEPQRPTTGFVIEGWGTSVSRDPLDRNNDGSVEPVVTTRSELEQARGGRLTTVITGCAGVYQPQNTSPYVLPYPPGMAFEITHGNCATPGSSHEFDGTNGFMFAYDFGMPIGTPVIAARAGTVIAVEERWTDGPQGVFGRENFVFVRNGATGNVARYWHLTQDGALVDVGQEVAQGDTIAWSGATGFDGTPQLHFDVVRFDCTGVGCPTLPVTFRNTELHPNGLSVGAVYPARPF